MNAYYNDSNIRKTSIEDKTTSAVCSIISFITSRTFTFVIKCAVIFAVLFGFVATVGMIDNGTIGFFVGICICALLSLVEIITIGSLSSQKKE